MKMLDIIDFSDSDILYVLGDVVDRGPKPVEILLDLMDRKNVFCIMGNHETMFCECIDVLLSDVTQKSIDDLTSFEVENILRWSANGSVTTTDGLHRLDRDMRIKVADFVRGFPLYAEVYTAAGSFVLVHAGLGNFSPGKKLSDYTVDELVWERPDYEKQYFKDRFLVTGHTPTQIIDNNPRKGFIYTCKNNIDIDCGCAFEGGRLGCLRLDDLEEFYVECVD